MISRRTEGAVLVCELEGRLDAVQSGPIQDELLEIIAGSGQKVLLHLGKVAYVSSMGLRVLVRAAKQVHSDGGTLKLCGASDAVSTLLEISGMAGLFDIRDTEESALSAF